jgi:hypothetical protein
MDILNNDSQRRVLLWVSSIATVILVIIGVVTYRHTEHVRITGVAWSREIRIESWQTVRHDEWDLPADGRLIATHEEIHHWDRVYAGSHSESYSCGTSSKPKTCTRSVSDYRSVAVYRTKYLYDRDEWAYKGSLVRNGSDKDATWADTTDLREPDGSPRLGDERLGARVEHYYVDVPDRTEVPFTDWQTYAIGQPVSVVRTITGSVDTIAHDK